jgi:hypothetical protein
MDGDGAMGTYPGFRMAGYGTVMDIPADTQPDEKGSHYRIGPFPPGMDALVDGRPYPVGRVQLMLFRFVPQELLKTTMSVISLHTQL